MFESIELSIGTWLKLIALIHGQIYIKSAAGANDLEKKTMRYTFGARQRIITLFSPTFFFYNFLLQNSLQFALNDAFGRFCTLYGTNFHWKHQT